MKKNLISFVLAGAMAGSLLGGSMSAFAEDAEGTVLNIYCWNTEFQDRVTAHYPGYEAVDETHGKIGDVSVAWNITSNQDNAYQINLDEALLGQEEASADDKVDIFLCEADYAKKYMNTDFAMPIADLGITDEELAKQYQYTKDVASDENGVLKGLSWQACPSGLIYNRAIAKEVLGSDDPADVQEAVKDWDAFKATADKMKEAGYLMTAGVNETFRIYSNNSADSFVQDGKLSVSEDMNRWIDDSKELIDKGETTSAAQWGDDWSKYFYPQEEGGAFCYFGPLWYFGFCMAQDTEGSIAYEGGWGLTEGPQSFYWGGTWICAAAGTDNPSLVADIMRALTTDNEIMKSIATVDHDYVNNTEVVAELAESEDGNSSVLGGQNPYGMLSKIADTIDPQNLTAYDQGCVEQLQGAMKDYYDGNAEKEAAIENYYKAVETLYPELTH